LVVLVGNPSCTDLVRVVRVIQRFLISSDVFLGLSSTLGNTSSTA
jgi:hypothetical protein